MSSAEQTDQVSQRAALAGAAATLRAAGVSDAPAQARRLLERVLDVAPAELLRRDPDAPLPPGAVSSLQSLVARRAAGEPLQHLTGRAPFRGLSVAVGPGVFVPRPETELLVELALAAAPDPARVIDLGSGSGAIALSIAAALPNAEVIAVERSVEALAWLRRNVEARTQAGDRPVRIIAADFADPAVADDGQPLQMLRGSADLVIANPPYVPAGVEVPIEVRADPSEAVFSGADGLDAIRAIVPLALRLARVPAALAIEHDETHQPQVEAILRSTEVDGRRFAEVRRYDDLTGRPRFVAAVATGRMPQ